LLKVLTGQFFLVESLEGRFEPAPQQCRDFVAGESGVAVRVEPLEESTVFARGLAGAAPLLAAQTLEVLARQLPVSEPLEQRSHPLPRPGGQIVRRDHSVAVAIGDVKQAAEVGALRPAIAAGPPSAFAGIHT